MRLNLWYLLPILAVAATPPTPLQRQAQVVSEKSKQLKRESLQVQGADAQFQAAVQQKRSEYGQREEKASLDALEKAVDCLRKPEGCMSKDGADGKPGPWPKPSMIDIFKILRDALNDRVFPTLQDLADLKTQGKEVELKHIAQAQHVAELKVAEKKLMDMKKTHRTNSSARQDLPPMAKLNPPDPVWLVEALKDAKQTLDSLPQQTRDIDQDLADELCYPDQGDRCFDGRPKELKAYLDKHPQYNQPGVPKDAITSAPNLSTSNAEFDQYQYLCVSAIEQVNNDLAECKRDLAKFEALCQKDPSWCISVSSMRDTCALDERNVKMYQENCDAYRRKHGR